MEFMSYCNRCHADRAKDYSHPKRYASASSISDETVTLIVMLGACGFLSGVCGGEYSLLYNIHRWNLPILTMCLGEACFGERVFLFYFFLMLTRAIS